MSSSSSRQDGGGGGGGGGDGTSSSSSRRPELAALVREQQRRAEEAQRAAVASLAVPQQQQLYQQLSHMNRAASSSSSAPQPVRPPQHQQQVERVLLEEQYRRQLAALAQQQQQQHLRMQEQQRQAVALPALRPIQTGAAASVVVPARLATGVPPSSPPNGKRKTPAVLAALLPQPKHRKTDEVVRRRDTRFGRRPKTLREWGGVVERLMQRKLHERAARSENPMLPPAQAHQLTQDQLQLMQFHYLQTQLRQQSERQRQQQQQMVLQRVQEDAGGIDVMGAAWNPLDLNNMILSTPQLPMGQLAALSSNLSPQPTPSLPPLLASSSLMAMSPYGSTPQRNSPHPSIVIDGSARAGRSSGFSPPSSTRGLSSSAQQQQQQQQSQRRVGISRTPPHTASSGGAGGQDGEVKEYSIVTKQMAPKRRKNFLGTLRAFDESEREEKFKQDVRQVEQARVRPPPPRRAVAAAGTTTATSGLAATSLSPSQPVGPWGYSPAASPFGVGLAPFMPSASPPPSGVLAAAMFQPPPRPAPPAPTRQTQQQQEDRGGGGDRTRQQKEDARS